MNRQQKSTEKTLIDRKGFLQKAAVTALALTSAPALFADKKGRKEDEHQHHHRTGSNYPELVRAGNICLQDGRECLDHCIELVKRGDTNIAGCMDTVTEMLSVCQTLVDLASYNSRRMKEYAAVCIGFCEDCIYECKKHADRHEACRRCLESCERCMNECKKVA